MSILSKDIIKEWGLGALSETKKADMVSRISHILFQAILVKSLDILSEEEQTELDELMDQNVTTPEDVLVFLKSKIPTFDRLVKDERKSLKEDLILANL